MSGALHLAPALLALLLLWLGRYPGEQRILAFKARLPRRRVRVAAPAPRRRSPWMPRGGRLLATCLAGRAPPSAPPPPTHT